MTSNNIYDTLLEMAKIQNIQLSQQQSQRQSQNLPINQFTNKMKDIRYEIQQIKKNNIKILKMKQKIIGNALPQKQSQLFKQIGNLCDQNYQFVIKIKSQLQNLTSIVQTTQQQHPDQPQTRAQIYQKQYMIQQVNTMILQTQKVQKLIQKFSINTTLNRIKALSPGITDSQAQKIAKKKDGFQQLIVQKSLGKQSLKLRYWVQDIVQKNEQIKKLQRSVAQNLKLMQYISVLVKQQGQMIDNIHDNIINAKDYMEKAEKVLEKKKGEGKKKRKKMCCIILVGVIILALIITPIILTIVNNNKAKNKG